MQRQGYAPMMMGNGYSDPWAVNGKFQAAVEVIFGPRKSRFQRKRSQGFK